VYIRLASRFGKRIAKYTDMKSAQHFAHARVLSVWNSLPLNSTHDFNTAFYGSPENAGLENDGLENDLFLRHIG